MSAMCLISLPTHWLCLPPDNYLWFLAGRRGIEFVVDCGPYVGPLIGSTVIGMSTGNIEIFRVGKGDVYPFVD